MPEPALREQALGDLQGRLSRELRAQPTPAGVHVSEVRWGGGERIADVHARLVAYFARLLVDPPRRRVALVSDGYPPDKQPAAIKLVMEQMEQMEAMAPSYAAERQSHLSR